jgi:hypothetical protein
VRATRDYDIMPTMGSDYRSFLRLHGGRARTFPEAAYRVFRSEALRASYENRVSQSNGTGKAEGTE